MVIDPRGYVGSFGGIDMAHCPDCGTELIEISVFGMDDKESGAKNIIEAWVDKECNHSMVPIKDKEEDYGLVLVACHDCKVVFVADDEERHHFRYVGELGSDMASAIKAVMLKED